MGPTNKLAVRTAQAVPLTGYQIRQTEQKAQGLHGGGPTVSGQRELDPEELPARSVDVVGIASATLMTQAWLRATYHHRTATDGTRRERFPRLSHPRDSVRTISDILGYDAAERQPSHKAGYSSRELAAGEVVLLA
jgi:hypothetical protein